MCFSSNRKNPVGSNFSQTLHSSICPTEGSEVLSLCLHPFSLENPSRPIGWSGAKHGMDVTPLKLNDQGAVPWKPWVEQTDGRGVAQLPARGKRGGSGITLQSTTQNHVGGRPSKVDLHFQTERVSPVTHLSDNGMGLQGFSVSS